MSATHVSFGRDAAKWRWTRSGAGGAFRVRGRRAHPLAPPRDALDLELAHQPRDTLGADPQTLAERQLGPQPWRAVDLVGVPPRLQDPRLQPLILDPASTRRPFRPRPVALPADAKHRTQQGDGVVRPLLIDQPERHGS